MKIHMIHLREKRMMMMVKVKEERGEKEDHMKKALKKENQIKKMNKREMKGTIIVEKEKKVKEMAL